MVPIRVKTSSGRPPTPPHFSTYNVHCPPARISEMITQIFTDETRDTIQRLPSGQSFNNRIYFLTMKERSNANSTASSHDLVLKISGQFFGPAKIQNEASCLLLLEKHCPDVPTPKVIAWSENGTEYVTVVREGPEVQISRPSKLSATEGKDHGWILMTRLPGRTLQPEDLQSHGETIMCQLAQHVAKIRTVTPLSQDIGNILISSLNPSEQGDNQSTPSTSPVQTRTQGLLIAGISPSDPFSSQLQYQTYKITDQLSILESEDIFTPNKDKLSLLLRNFISDTLSYLPLSSLSSSPNSTPPSPVFTHYDLSPRNVLISQSSSSPSSSSSSTPTITALLDLEFAGFFPPYEEFTNSRITHADYWDDSAWDIFPTELRRLEVHVPEHREWEQAVAFTSIDISWISHTPASLTPK